MTNPKAIPSDYDSDPDRFRTNVLAVERYGLATDVHDEVAHRMAEETPGPRLDLGCGEGRLTKPLLALGAPTVSMDLSATMLAAVTGNRVLGDASRLPFQSQAFGSVAALYMLYHLDEPRQALTECLRVLRPGGLFAACAPSRFNDPELADVLPPSKPETFDGENGQAMIAEFFEYVEVERWDAPLIYLPDRNALLVYLQGRQLERTTIDYALGRISTPL
jgi:SAM-dependent methyltransferase